MKKIVALILCCVIYVIGVSSYTMAQPVEIDCGDDVIIREGVDIQFPNVDINTSYTVTALGIDEYDPVIAVFNEQQNGGCNDDADGALTYSVDLPTTEYVEESELNSQMAFTGSWLMRVVAGEFENLDGEAVIMVEGLTFDGTPDLVNVIVTNDMIRSRIPLTAYVIEVEPGLDLSLAVVDDNGVPLQDAISQPVQCDDAGDNELCWGLHFPLVDSFTSTGDTDLTSGTALSPMLSIPLTANDVETIAPFQIQQSATAEESKTGEYIFLLHYGVGDVELPTGVASSDSTILGTSLSCEDEVILSDAIEITIPRLDGSYSIHALAQSLANPIMAIVDDNGDGECYLTSDNGDELYADLPIVGIFNRSVNNASATITTPTARILTGIANDASGSYLMAIDGLSISSDESDVVSLTVTEAMVESGEPLTAFIVAHDLDLNPQLALVSAEQEILTSADGLPIACTLSDQPEGCWGEYETMAGSEISLGVDNRTLGIRTDVMLRIPLTSDLVGTSINLMGSGLDGTTGDYILILHLPMGQQTDES